MAGQIHRKKKNKNFVVLDTHCLRNPALKWDAKGLHSYLMQLPDDWKINISDLTNRSKDGTEGTSTPMNALIKAGYVKRIRISGERGRFDGYDYDVFERPQEVDDKQETDSTVTGFPVHGKTVHGESVNGKPGTNKNEESKNEENIYTAPKSPKVETLDEALKAVFVWLNAGGVETVKVWYDQKMKKYDQKAFVAELERFCSNYLNTSDEGRSQKFKRDPVAFFQNGFRSWLSTSEAFNRDKPKAAAQSVQHTNELHGITFHR
jgi:hypothetical protein